MNTVNPAITIAASREAALSYSYAAAESLKSKAKSSSSAAARPEPSLTRILQPTIPMSRLRTFIVEDSPVIREDLIAALEELAPVDVVGFADTADDANAWAAENRGECDLMIIDIALRRGSGTQVLRDVCGKAAAPACVVLTNYATPHVRSTCLSLGAERVFDKSNDIEPLIDYCGALLQRLADSSASS